MMRAVAVRTHDPGFPASVRNECLSPVVKGRPETVLIQLGERMGELDLLLYSLKLNRSAGGQRDAILRRALEQADQIAALLASLDQGSVR
jgi:hypothetical protein